MTTRTITFDDEQWQVVPRRLPGAMIDTINGHIDADSDAVALWRDALIDAPEPPAQQPTRDLLAEATEQVEALKRENHRMRRCVARLMARLTVWLDDDQFNEADGIMYPEFEPPAQQPSMEAAIAAGDGTLHGAIDHWQERALAAEAKLAAQQPMTDASRDVLAERHRQIEAEGWTPEHDDEHEDETIAAMACFYAMPPGAREWCAESTGYGATLGEAILPEGWEAKTGDRRRDLVKAGALILAEIERLDRAGIGKGESNAG